MGLRGSRRGGGSRASWCGLQLLHLKRGSDPVGPSGSTPGSWAPRRRDRARVARTRTSPASERGHPGLMWIDENNATRDCDLTRRPPSVAQRAAPHNLYGRTPEDCSSAVASRSRPTTVHPTSTPTTEYRSPAIRCAVPLKVPFRRGVRRHLLSGTRPVGGLEAVSAHDQPFLDPGDRHAPVLIAATNLVVLFIAVAGAGEGQPCRLGRRLGLHQRSTGQGTLDQDSHMTPTAVHDCGRCADRA